MDFSPVLPVGLWLKALTVVTVWCCHRFPCMVHNGNDVFTAAFLLLTRRLSVLLWHPCTVRTTVQDAIVSSVCACVCMRALLVHFVRWLYIPSHVYVCTFACLPSSDNCEWMAEFVFLVLPEARFHFRHTGVSLSPSLKQRGAGFLEGSGARTTMLIP